MIVEFILSLYNVRVNLFKEWPNLNERMNDLDNEQLIQQWVLATMKEVAIETELRLKQNGRNMVYDFIHDYVGIDIGRVQQTASDMTDPVPLEIYIKILTLHELGHALDRTALLASLPRTIEIFEMKAGYSIEEQNGRHDLQMMRVEEQEMNLAFEMTAWDHAAVLNEKFHIADPASFEAVKRHSLISYTDSLEEERRLLAALEAPLVSA